MIRAAFFDIDGTLVSKHDLSIPSSTIKAIKLLKEKGIKTGIATGRHTLEMEEEHLIKDLTFDYYVTLNGQLCYQNNKLVHHHPIDSEDVKKMLKISEEKQIPVMLIEENDMYLNFCNEDVMAAQHAIHTSIPPIKKIDQDDLSPIYQMCIYTTDNNLSYLDTLQHTSRTQWHSAAYDLIPTSGSKTEGISKVIAQHHISLDEVICFGDGDNDVDMLLKCGIGVAMKESSLKALEAADYVTDSVEDNGIYTALKHFKII